MSTDWRSRALAAETNLTELREALKRALELSDSVFRSTPVRDDTRDAHFDLEHLRRHLSLSLQDSRLARYRREGSVAPWEPPNELTDA